MKTIIVSSKVNALLSAVVCVVFVLLFNLTSCKEDDGIDWNYEDINTKWITVRGGGITEIKDPRDVTEVTVSGSMMKIDALRNKGGVIGASSDQHIEIAVDYGIAGGRMEHIEGAKEVTVVFDKPFEEYIVKSVIYGKDDNGNVSKQTDTLTMHVYYVPDIDLTLSRSFGDGEDATTVKWNIRCYDVSYGYTNLNEREIDLFPNDKYLLKPYDSDSYLAFEKSEIRIQDDVRKHFNVTINMTSDEAPCDVKPMEFDGSVDSVYIKKDIDKGILMTHHSVYGTINGISTYFYEDAYKYNFKASLKIPVGNMIIEKIDTIESILVDNNAFAIDDELNIYNTVKIGEDVWTIDNYRGTKVEYYLPADPQYANEGFYLYSNRDLNTDAYNNWLKINNHIINGYHLSSEEDWERLESYLGIVCANADLNRAGAELSEILNCENTTQYADYFATNVPWHVFDSDNGYVDTESLSKYPFSFNVRFCGGKSDAYSDMTSFAVSNGDRIIVSKRYKSIAKLWLNMYSNVRLVKDRK